MRWREFCAIVVTIRLLRLTVKLMIVKWTYEAVNSWIGPAIQSSSLQHWLHGFYSEIITLPLFIEKVKI